MDNGDIFAFALYRLQGTGRFVDVEDVFEECWKLSPSRFGWRKHAYPNYKVASKAQRDFESRHPSLILKTPDGLGRQLSAEGIAWVLGHLDEFEPLARGDSKAPAPRRASHRLVAELERSPVVEAFLRGAEVAVNKIQMADLLRCAPDSPPSVWRQRMETARSAAKDNERLDILRFLDCVVTSNQDWFDGGVER
jgi:hypothetical protein